MREWWPGGTSRWSVAPRYPRRVTVIDTSRGNLWYRRNRNAAIREWNRCNAGIVLEVGEGAPFSEGTITLFVDADGVGQDGPYGTWQDGHGFVAFAGGWTRSRAVIAHELGHALGFGHSPDVATTEPDGVMGNGQHVSEAECEGLRHYYGGRA